jgi:hypothetical protein
MEQLWASFFHVSETAKSGGGKIMKCQICKTAARTESVRFVCVIGMLFVSRFFTVKGEMCQSCMLGKFAEYTLSSLALGWWGVPAILATPFVIAYNVAGCAAAWLAFRFSVHSGAEAVSKMTAH